MESYERRVSGFSQVGSTELLLVKYVQNQQDTTLRRFKICIFQPDKFVKDLSKFECHRQT